MAPAMVSSLAQSQGLSALGEGGLGSHNYDDEAEATIPLTLDDSPGSQLKRTPSRNPANEEGDEKDDTLQPHPAKSNKKQEPAPLETKRRAQNRAAQRAFRERRERYLKELETRIHELENESLVWQHTSSALRSKVQELEDQLNVRQGNQLPLQGHNVRQNPMQPIPNQMFGVTESSFGHSAPGQRTPAYSPYADMGNSKSNTVSAGPFTFSYPFDKSKQLNGAPLPVPPPLLQGHDNTLQQEPSPVNQSGYISPPTGPSSRINSNQNLAGSQKVSRWQSQMMGQNVEFQSPPFLSSPEKHDSDPSAHSSVSEASFTPQFDTPNGPDEFCANLSLACPTRQLPLDNVLKSQDVVSSDLDFLSPAIATKNVPSWSELADPLSILDMPELAANDFNFFDPLDDLLNETFSNTPNFPPGSDGSSYPGSGPTVSTTSTAAVAADSTVNPSATTTQPKTEIETLLSHQPVYEKTPKPEHTPSKAQAEDDDDLVPAATGKLMSCMEVWDRVSAHPRFSDIDMDSLCQELRTKARCSDTGVVFPEGSLDSLLTTRN